MKQLLALILVCCAVLRTPAHASTVRVDDRAGVFGGISASAIRLETDRWPFDLKIITARYATVSDQDLEVHRCSDAPKVVCISVDVARKTVVAHFGWGAGVNPLDFERITGAGTALLHAGDWRGGAEAIADAAAVSARGGVCNTPTVTAPAVEPQQKIEIENGWLIFIATVLAIVGLYLLLNWDEVYAWYKWRG